MPDEAREDLLAWDRYREYPHIVQILEVGEHDGLPDLALEHCPGDTLEEKLAGTPLPAREAKAALHRLGQRTVPRP